MVVKWRIWGSTVGPDGEGRRNSNNKLAESITLRKVKHSRQTQKLTRKIRLAIRPKLLEVASGACDGKHDGALVESQHYWVGGGCVEAGAISMLGGMAMVGNARDRFIRRSWIRFELRACRIQLALSGARRQGICRMYNVVHTRSTDRPKQFWRQQGVRVN